MRHGLGFLGLAALVGGCGDPCGNAPVAEHPAPDGRHVAVLFRRDCGATTGVSVQLSILGPGERPRGAGNAFRADGGDGAAGGDPRVGVRWLAPDRLALRHAAGARVFLREARVAGVAITDEAPPP